MAVYPYNLPILKFQILSIALGEGHGACGVDESMEKVRLITGGVSGEGHRGDQQELWEGPGGRKGVGGAARKARLLGARVHGP